jgi:hypothetical protein
MGLLINFIINYNFKILEIYNLEYSIKCIEL